MVVGNQAESVGPAQLLRKPQIPYTAFALRSIHDGHCLLPSPLRFSQRCDDDSAIFRLDPRGGGRLEGEVHPRLTLARRRGEGAHAHVVCADRWCVRCVSRGNANRARVGLCALEGFEAVRPIDVRAMPPAPVALIAAPPSELIVVVSAALMVVVAVFGRICARRASRRAARRVRAGCIMDLRRLRLELRAARDEARPARLLRLLREGGRFTELTSIGGASLHHPVKYPAPPRPFSHLRSRQPRPARLSPSHGSECPQHGPPRQWRSPRARMHGGPCEAGAPPIPSADPGCFRRVRRSS